MLWLLGAAIAGVTGWTMLQPGPIDLNVVRIANPAGVGALGDLAVQAVGTVPALLAFLTLFVGSLPAPWRRSCGADGAGRSSASSSSGWRLWRR